MSFSKAGFPNTNRNRSVSRTRRLLDEQPGEPTLRPMFQSPLNTDISSRFSAHSTYTPSPRPSSSAVPRSSLLSPEVTARMERNEHATLNLSNRTPSIMFLSKAELHKWRLKARDRLYEAIKDELFSSIELCMLATYPYTFASFELEDAVYPAEFAVTFATFDKGVTSSDSWRIDFDTELFYGKRFERIPEWNSTLFEALVYRLGYCPLLNSSMEDCKKPKKVYRELTDKIKWNKRIFIDARQYNFIVPSYYFLLKATYGDTPEVMKRLVEFSATLFPIQDLALVTNFIHGKSKGMRASAIDRYFERGMKPKDNMFYCALHRELRDTIDRLHCPHAHSMRLLHAFFAFSKTCQFNEARRFNAQLHTFCEPLSEHEQYNMRAPLADDKEERETDAEHKQLLQGFATLEVEDYNNQMEGGGSASLLFTPPALFRRFKLKLSYIPPDDIFSVFPEWLKGMSTMELGRKEMRVMCSEEWHAIPRTERQQKHLRAHKQRQRSRGRDTQPR